MAAGIGVEAYATIGAPAASITTGSFTPTYGADARLAIGIRWLPETNAAPSSITDSEGGNTYAAKSTITTDSNGYKYQVWASTGTLSGTGGMTLTVNFTGGATNNAEAGSHITVVSVTGAGNATASAGQAQTVTAGTDNASTGAIGAGSASGIAVAFFSHNVAPDNMTPSSGWTLIAFNNSAGGAYAMSQYRATVDTSSVTATCSVDQDGTMNNHGILFPAAGGSTYTLTCTQQTYAITGNATGLLAGRRLTATQQSYTLTGQAVTLTYAPSGARTLTCDSQTYTLTGYDVTLSPQSPPAAYVLTGNDVGLLASTRVLTCDQQTYTLTGVAIGFLTNRVLTCVSAAYALNGTTTNLVYSNAPATGGIGTDSVRPLLRPYLGVKRRLAAYL